MTTSLVVGISKPGCGLPPALSFKDVHHPCWGGGRAELGPRLPHGLTARFFPQYPGEKGVRQPCEGGELWVRGAGRLQVPPATACPVIRLGWPRRRLRRCLRRCVGAWLSVHRTGDGRAVRRSATPTASPALPAALRGCIWRRASRGRRLRSWMSSLLSEDRSEDLFARAEAAVANVAEVVASAGETISATCRRASNSLALMASLSPPVGRRGRGPFRSGVRAEVIAATGESSVQRRPSPSVLMWSPPLASCWDLADVS
jgi:hypothetical protein